MILKATLEDASVLTEIALQSKAYWGYTSVQIESWHDDLTVKPVMFEDWIVYKYLIEGTIVGFFILNLQDSTEKSSLEFLFVHPDFIGKRIGLKLLNHASYLSACEGRMIMTLEADPNAEAFYAKHGFVVVGKTKSSVPDRFLPVMEKELLL